MNKWKSEVERRHNKPMMGEPIVISDDQEFEEYFSLEHQRLIKSANNEFGINNWNHSINRQEIDCIDVFEGKYNVGVSALVRVELKSGRYHEGLGYGISCGKRSKPLSVYIARKQALLDGLRFALQCFYDVPKSTLEVPASKGYGQDNQVPRLIVLNSGLDEVDNTQNHISKYEKKLQTPPKMNNDVNVLWKKPKRSSDTAVQNIESTPPTCGRPKTTGTPMSHLNTLTGNDIEDEERKLERKRKQRQKQEEFRQRFKQNQAENIAGQCLKSGEKGKMDELIENLDATEASFISTQELNEMIQTTTGHSKPVVPLCRVPLLSSPPKDGSPHKWKSGHGQSVDMKRTSIKAETYR